MLASVTVSTHESAGSISVAGARAPLAELEIALAALVRWSESSHVRSEVARRSRSSLPQSSLRLLEHFDVAGAMRVKDIAECLGIDISTASLQLRALKREQLVTREQDPADGRSGIVAISEKGRRVLEQVRAVRRDLLREVFGEVPEDQLEQAAQVLLLIQRQMLDGMAESGYLIAR
jgi:DNA-binding MarR family transcriptional regulator